MPETTGAAPKPAKQSSPRYPFISLTKALERAEQLRKVAGTNMAFAADARASWGYAPKSSGGDQTIAALSYYGLLEDSGSGDARKVKLSDNAIRYLRDERPEVRAELSAKFVMLPKAMQRLWEEWKHEPPAENIARSLLKNDMGYSDWAAGELLEIYKDNLQFIPKATSGIVPNVKEPNEGDKAKPPPLATVKVGDYVQWTSNGQHQFPTAKRVEWVSEDGQYARVLGSQTGLPMSELSVSAGPAQNKPADPSFGAAVTPLNPIEVFMGSDGRLQVSANVDADGLQKLRDLLGKYDEILKLMGGKAS